MFTVSKPLLATALLALPMVLSAKDDMKLSSPSFEDGAKIPAKHTRDRGQRDISPPLSWEGAPAGTKSFAVLCIDHHPVAKMWVHWVVFDVPASTTSLPEGLPGKARLNNGIRQGRNNFGQTGWGGPQPPPRTGDHDYVFTIFALDLAKLPVRGAPTAAQLKAALKGHVLAEATLTGVYAR